MGFKESVNSLLAERGLRQADLCRMTGIDSGLMSNYLNGKKAPSLSNAVLIADALAVPMDRIAGRSEAETAAQRELLSYFNQLNEEGQESAIRMVQGMTSVDVYKKSYPVRMGKERSA